MTILDSSECPNCDPPYKPSFATTMSMRRSSRVVRKPKYYIQEVTNDQLDDELVTSSDHSDTEWNQTDSDVDEKPRKKVKLGRCSVTSTDDTPTTILPTSRRLSSSSKQVATPTKSKLTTIHIDSSGASGSGTLHHRSASHMAHSPPENAPRDENYQIRRERNNISVRKSRARVREATKAAVKCIDELTREKNQLAKDQEVLDKEISLLKQLIYQTFSPEATTAALKLPVVTSSPNSPQEEHSYSSKPIESKPQVIDLSKLMFFDEMLDTI